MDDRYGTVTLAFSLTGGRLEWPALRNSFICVSFIALNVFYMDGPYAQKNMSWTEYIYRIYSVWKI